VLPLELEWGRERINALFKGFRGFAIAAIDPNSTLPFRTTPFDPHDYAECANSNTAHITKAFTHAFENTGAIVAPLILIITADKIRCACPVFVLNRVEKILSMTPDLTLRPPKPDKKEPDTKREG